MNVGRATDVQDMSTSKDLAMWMCKTIQVCFFKLLQRHFEMFSISCKHIKKSV